MMALRTHYQGTNTYWWCLFMFVYFTECTPADILRRSTSVQLTPDDKLSHFFPYKDTSKICFSLSRSGDFTNQHTLSKCSISWALTDPCDVFSTQQHFSSHPPNTIQLYAIITILRCDLATLEKIFLLIYTVAHNRLACWRGHDVIVNDSVWISHKLCIDYWGKMHALH